VAKEPLYSQIATRAAALIAAGEWQPGQRLPPERVLCERLGVSRTTLRLALAELEARGLISRHQGRGTFVTRPRLDADATDSFSLSAALLRRGHELRSRVLAVEAVEAGRHVATDLGCRPGDPVLRLERLRLLDGEPLMLELAHLPLDRFPDLATKDFEARSLYAILAEDYGTRPALARESLEPVVCRTREATILGLPRRAPALRIVRLTADEHGRPIETNDALLRGDRCRILLTRTADGWLDRATSTTAVGWLERISAPSVLGATFGREATAPGARPTPRTRPAPGARRTARAGRADR
jgi:GntR family transcriptional regulator